jgi:hypothetical protein
VLTEGKRTGIRTMIRMHETNVRNCSSCIPSKLSLSALSSKYRDKMAKAESNTRGEVMHCSVCGKEVSENDLYTFDGKEMCDKCCMNEGLYPLGHSGMRRDKISEDGRRRTIWWSENG